MNEERHFLVIINEAKNFIILERTKIGAIHRAVVNYEVMYPNLGVRTIKIITMREDAVLKCRELLRL